MLHFFYIFLTKFIENEQLPIFQIEKTELIDGWSEIIRKRKEGFLKKFSRKTENLFRFHRMATILKGI